jgi:hypothetical protein
MHRQRPSITLSWDRLPTLCTVSAESKCTVDGETHGLRLRNGQSSRSGDQGDEEGSDDSETHCWLTLGGGDWWVTKSVVLVFTPCAAFICSLPALIAPLRRLRGHGALVIACRINAAVCIRV